jgi:two-component system chemotaxis response regulator CheB
MAMKLNETEAKRCIEASCPECRGPLSEISLDELREYSCLVGHRYSARGLLQAHSETQEQMLWAAVVTLEECANLIKAIASEFPEAALERLREQVAKKLQQAAEIRRILEELEPFWTQSSEP